MESTHCAGWKAIATSAALIAMMFASAAQAAPVRIVALGASNVSGVGVGSQAAWPAQLEAMLRAKGYDATVTNSGVAGGTTETLRGQASAVPAGTQVVIVEVTTLNNRAAGISGAQRTKIISQVKRELAGRGIKVVDISNIRGMADGQLQADGIHLTAQGHATVAAKMLPRVMAAIGRK
jgi:acyl-CoA thioesterase I